MAANDGTIASKLQLDGEQQYKKALNDAYRSLRVLRSELKAETAELGRNATAQDKAKTKMASLQKQIAQQEKIVKTLEKALEDSKKEYADNQEVQDKWAEKLNKARAALADMQNQLGGCQDSLEDFSGAMKDVAGASGDAMTTVISFNDAMKSIGNIASGIGDSLSGIFSATLDTMKEMVDEMFSLMSEAWAAAGQWKEIQTIWGGDLASIEKVYTAMGLQGIDAGTVTSGIQKFITNVHNGNEDTLAALEQLHLTESTFANHWDFFVAVMDKASMFKGQEQYNLMTALFGDKKGAGMTNMLKNWRDAMDRYEADVEKTRLGLSSPEIEALDQVAHKIKEIQELWSRIRTNIGAKLSEVLNMDQLSDDALEILRDIGSLLSGNGDSKEITIKLEEDIAKLLTDVSDSLGDLGDKLKELGGTLKDSNNPLVSLVGRLIESLGGVLDWISANSDTIVAWLNKLLPVMAVNKGFEALTGKGIGDWVTDIIKIGVDFAVLGKLFGSSAGTAIGATAGTFGAAIGHAILWAVPGLAFLATLLTPSATSDATGDNTLIGSNGERTTEAQAYGYSVDENGEIYHDVNQVDERLINPEYRKWLAGEEALQNITQEQIQAAEDFWDVMRENPYDYSDDDWDRFEGAFEGQEALLDTVISKMDAIIQGVPDESWRDIENLPADWYSSISGALKNLTRDNYKGDIDDSLPGKLEAAVERGASRKPVHVVVQLEGQTIMDYFDHGLGGRLSPLIG